MDGKFLILALLLVQACVEGKETSENPKSILAMKKMLENGGFIQGSGCDANQCPPGYNVCCDQKGLVIYCCNDVRPKCFKDDGVWRCKAGAANISINIGILVALAIFATAKANFISTLF